LWKKERISCNKFCSRFYIFAWWWSCYMFHILWSALGIDFLIELLLSFTKTRIQIGFLVHHSLPISTNNPPLFYWTSVLYSLNHHFCFATTHDTSVICREFIRALIGKRGEVVRLPQIFYFTNTYCFCFHKHYRRMSENLEIEECITMAQFNEMKRSMEEKQEKLSQDLQEIITHLIIHQNCNTPCYGNPN
jgi:hypothetical protein